MSKLKDIFIEKITENISELDEEEKKSEDECDNIAFHNREDNIQIIYYNNNTVKKVKTISKSPKKGQRLSYEPFYKLRHGSNVSINSIRASKRTVSDRNRNKRVLFSPLLQLKSSFIGSLKSLNFHLNEGSEKNRNRQSKTFRKSGKKQAGYFRKKTRQSDIYERSKTMIKWKNNKIEKQKNKQNIVINESLKNPEINRFSQFIVENSYYIPIQDRAEQLHKEHMIKCDISQRMNKAKEKEEQKQFQNKKKFNEIDWEQFIMDQERKKKEKLYKLKMCRKLRDHLQQKYYFIPEIDSNSNRIITDLRKNRLFIDDIHTRLYKDFDLLQERKKMRISNSMPSFKPRLNKSFNKNIFNNNKRYTKNNSYKFTNRFKTLIHKEVNKSKYSNNFRIFTNNTTTRNYIINSNILMNSYNIRNKRFNFGKPILSLDNYRENSKRNKSNGKIGIFKLII